MSAILSSDDLNDFISPGVACIKPVESIKTTNANQAKIEISMEGIPTETLESGQTKQLEKAQISLSDCLACSGCITSAESVLVSMQSHDELLSSLRSENGKNKAFVASISHQVRVSLSSAYGISIEKVDAKLEHLFINILNFKYLVGLEVGRVIALSQSFKEVLQNRNTQDSNSKSPILCSVCPGWTCYVEKTHPHIIPYLSRVKSPQQITGSLLKSQISKLTGLSKENIYHLSIMPCFDKKLEAARPEFGQDEARDVDCVITAKEIILLLQQEGIEFESLPDDKSTSSNISPKLWPAEEQWLSHAGSSSGGYLDYIMAGIQNSMNEMTKIKTIPGKNSDMIEFQLVDENDESKIHFRAARIYGFRNIQNLVRKLKQKETGPKGGLKTKMIARSSGRVSRRGKAKTESEAGTLSDPTLYDYVEVMACPGGCINGGGLIGAPADKAIKEWRQEMEDIYQSIPGLPCSNLVEYVEASSEKWVSDLWDPNSNVSPEYSLTSVEFHAVEDLNDPSNPSSNIDPNSASAPLALSAKW